MNGKPFIVHAKPHAVVELPEGVRPQDVIFAATSTPAQLIAELTKQRDELEAEYQQVVCDCAAIEEQLERWKDGVCDIDAPADWPYRARRALKHKKAAKQDLQRRVSHLDREIRRQHHLADMNGYARDERDKAFIRAAQEILDRHLFEAIWAAAERRIAAAKGADNA